MDAGPPGVGSLDELPERLGIVPRDPELFRQAFGHNERLEFYGDAVIGFTVSRLLYERYPDEDEGFLTARRAALVNRDALAAMALSIGLDRYLLLGRGEAEAGGATRPSVLAACLEALAGALSLSEGAERTDAILSTLFEPALDALAEISGPPKSAKSRLQEWTQRHRGVKPVYELLATTGPAHEQEFRVAVKLGGEALAEGEGSSRQRAEERAAEAALAALAPRTSPTDQAAAAGSP
jgi:ribonuclease-3